MVWMLNWCTRWGAHWHYLTNTAVPSMYIGDLALCQLNLTTCCNWDHTISVLLTTVHNCALINCIYLLTLPQIRLLLTTVHIYKLYIVQFPFTAVMLLIGRQQGHLPCKNNIHKSLCFVLYNHEMHTTRK